MKVLKLKTQYFRTKLPCQKQALRKMEWGVENGPILKDGFLPEPSTFFCKIYFSLKTSYEELTWCVN